MEKQEIYNNNICRNICSKCRSYVLITLYYDKKYKVKLECLLEHYNESIDLDTFFEFTNRKYIELLNQKCEKSQSHNEINGNNYCINCNKWLCDECQKIHSKYSPDHEMKILFPLNNDNNCSNHNDKSSVFLCFVCNLYLCRECCIKHYKYHYFLYLKFINNKENFDYLIYKFNENKKTFDYNLKIINYLKNKYNDDLTLSILINKAIYLSKIYSENVQKYFAFFQILIDNYTNSNNNIICFMNMYNNTFSDFEKITINKDQSLLYKINYVLTFFTFHTGVRLTKINKYLLIKNNIIITNFKKDIYSLFKIMGKTIELNLIFELVKLMKNVEKQHHITYEYSSEFKHYSKLNDEIYNKYCYLFFT